MIKKSMGLLALSVVLMTTSCKKESAADKITADDEAAIAIQNSLRTVFPKIKFDKLVHDFGVINEGDVVKTTFMVTNEGTVDLIISDAKGSCGTNTCFF